MAPEAATRAVEERVSELAAAMRAGGARVGVGELLAAHRALAAVDPADRIDAYFALRTTLCSTRAELALFAEAFAAVFAAEAPENPLAALGEIEKAALPRVGVPQTGAAALEPEPRTATRSRPPTATRSCCARRTSRPTRTPSGRWRGGCWPGSPRARRSG